jgi:hypothetical protein
MLCNPRGIRASGARAEPSGKEIEQERTKANQIGGLFQQLTNVFVSYFRPKPNPCNTLRTLVAEMAGGTKMSVKIARFRSAAKPNFNRS